MEITQMSIECWFFKSDMFIQWSIIWQKKRNEILIHARWTLDEPWNSWINLENAMLSKRSQSQNITYCIISLIWVSRISKCIEMESRLVVTLHLGGVVGQLEGDS